MANNIHEAIAAIYKEVGYVQKTGKNEAQRYRYAGESDLIAALRPSLAAHDVTFYCHDIIDSAAEIIRKETQKGESITVNRSAVYVFRFTHAPTGTHIDVKAQGEGSDSLDKASYKAATGALKYALRQTFVIETGDDPDQPAMATPAQMKALEELALMGSAATKKYYDDNYKSGVLADSYDKVFKSMNEAVRRYREAQKPSKDQETPPTNHQNDSGA